MIFYIKKYTHRSMFLTVHFYVNIKIKTDCIIIMNSIKIKN